MEMEIVKSEEKCINKRTNASNDSNDDDVVVDDDDHYQRILRTKKFPVVHFHLISIYVKLMV